MAKGYWIVRVDVKNEDGMKPYAAASPAIYKKFCGRYLVRSNKCEVPEGTTRSRHVGVEGFGVRRLKLRLRQQARCKPPAVV
jgi:uncharacterized protein (DUF1330 family)